MALPKSIPPQSEAFVYQDENGEMRISTDWYLFLYALSAALLSSGGGVAVSPIDMIAITDNDVNSTDAYQSYKQALNAQMTQPEVDSVDAYQTYRQIVNAQLLQPDLDVTPSLRDMTNALLLAQDALLQDPTPLAQPSALVTVGASPFAYTAPYTGTVSVSGGTVSAISIIRQGATVATGITAGLVPVSKFDQLKITYSVLPTVVFLPT